MGYLQEPMVFLIDIIFGVYVTVVLLRFLFQLFRVDFYNPVSQAIVTLTNPPLRLLRKIIPSVGKIDTSSIVLMILVQYIAFILIMLFSGGAFLPLALLAFSAIEIINHTFNLFIFAIVVLAILSWVSSPYQQNPVANLLNQLTRPIMAPIRRLLPPLGGLDLSPMLAIIGLFFLKLLIIPPLKDLARLIPF